MTSGVIAGSRVSGRSARSDSPCEPDSDGRPENPYTLRAPEGCAEDTPPGEGSSPTPPRVHHDTTSQSIHRNQPHRNVVAGTRLADYFESGS